MRLHLVSVGTRVPAWVNTGFKEFNKRLPKEFLLNPVEVQPVTRSKSSSAEKIMIEESKRIRANIPEGSLIVALDEHGKQLDSISLSKKLGSWARDGRDIAFIIGGADGLAVDIKNSADMLWSLSSLTLPHALVRVILVEQIYRAWTIMNNHPYHRE